MLLLRQHATLSLGLQRMEHPHVQDSQYQITVLGVDIGKKSLHVVGHDGNGIIVLGRSGRAARS